MKETLYVELKSALCPMNVVSDKNNDRVKNVDRYGVATSLLDSERYGTAKLENRCVESDTSDVCNLFQLSDKTKKDAESVLLGCNGRVSNNVEDGIYLKVAVDIKKEEMMDTELLVFELMSTRIALFETADSSYVRTGVCNKVSSKLVLERETIRDFKIESVDESSNEKAE